MYIKLIETKNQRQAEVLCDVCAQAIDLDEDCAYIKPQNNLLNLESRIAHIVCSKRPGRFQNCWTSLTRPRDILDSIVKTQRRNSKHPQLDALINDIAEQSAAKRASEDRK